MLTQATFELTRGEAPLLISLPHSGTELPDGFRERLTVAAQALPDTDWHVDRLVAFAEGLGVGVLRARLSRYVIDLNRDPEGTSLYPGQSTTGLCPLTTFADERIYHNGDSPNPQEISARIERYFRPYHAALKAELERLRSKHGFALLLDGHSIRAEVPRFFEGRLPDLNLGSYHGRSADDSLAARAVAVLARSPMSYVVNGRFTGGYITRHYGAPTSGVHALQLEMAQASYMDEAPPYRYDEARAAPLIACLRELVEALSTWRPA